MRKIWIIMIALSLFASGMAHAETTESGTHGLSFNEFLNKIFSGASSQETGANGTAKPTIADNLVDAGFQRLNNTINGQIQQPYNSMYQGQEQTTRESLVTCLYLGRIIEVNKVLSQEEAMANFKKARAGEWFASLNCNSVLSPYNSIFTNLDSTVSKCADNEATCQTLNKTALKPYVQSNTFNTPSGGIKK